jgi:hypothetical protein
MLAIVESKHIEMYLLTVDSAQHIPQQRLDTATA